MGRVPPAALPERGPSPAQQPAHTPKSSSHEGHEGLDRFHSFTDDPWHLHIASRQPHVIRSWWSKWPHASVGLVTGTVLDVCDIDTNTGLRVVLDLLDVARPPGPLTRPRAGSGRRHTFGVLVRNHAIDSPTGVADILTERAASGWIVGEVPLP